MDYKVIIAQAALRDLEKISAYIARHNAGAAHAFCLKMLEEAESLRTFPERGGLIVERPGARFVVVAPYLVVYRIEEQLHVVNVLRFWHGARERVRMRL